MCICTCVCVTGSRDELIQQCLIALKESLPELTDHNHSGYIATVGVATRKVTVLCVHYLHAKSFYIGIASLSHLTSRSFTSYNTWYVL